MKRENDKQRMIDVLSKLMDIEGELRQLGMWNKEPMPLSALESVQPFCIDTMSFVQWLQFVFIPTLREIIEAGRPLPNKCAVAPMAEEYFRGLSVCSKRLETYLIQMDKRLEK